MRILHTSDWHLGRSFHGAHLLDAQVKVLDSVVEVVKAESIDVVIVAGDIYDRAVPAADAVAALDHLIGEIRAAGASVVGISGNHDSAVRIGFGEKTLSAGGITLRGDVAACGRPVIIPERDGSAGVAFYPIPYLEIETARHALATPEARSHDKLLQVALDRARADLDARAGMRSVAIVHAFVTGGQSCESELALSVGGSAEVPLRCLKGFDYIALGHLHGRQSLGSGKARYSGSPLPYSFSERTHVKGGWIVDLAADGTTTVRSVDFPVHRSLFQVRGELEGLLTDSALRDAEQGFVQAILTDSLLPMEAMAKLRRRFPHIVLMSHEPPQQLGNELTYSERIKGRTDIELALDFVQHVAGRPADELERAELTAAIDQPVSSSDRAA